MITILLSAPLQRGDNYQICLVLSCTEDSTLWYSKNTWAFLQPNGLPVCRVRKRGVIVLVEFCEGRLRRLEERKILHTTIHINDHQSMSASRAFAACKHEVWSTLDESVVVRSFLANGVYRGDAVPFVFLHHDPASTHQLRVCGQEVPATLYAFARQGRNKLDKESGNNRLNWEE